MGDIEKGAEMILADRKKCTGCRACYSICPHNAIEMQPDSNSFLFPKIIKDQCTQCGLCSKTCPVLNPSLPIPPRECYVAVSRNKDLHIKSSSGGIFGELALLTLRHGGFVVGCAWDKKLKAKHLIVKEEKDLPCLYTSKYVQSELGDILLDIKELLSSKKKVLFSGTPCQIAGLKKFLGRNYNNLLTVEVICHGVPSPKVFEKYKKECEKKYRSKLISVNFRGKDAIHQNDYTFLRFKKKTVKSERNDDIYFQTFVKNLSLRESCFNCCSNDGKSGADITIGDFWGIQNLFPDYYKNHGLLK